jgi:hypothetical protein
MPEEMTSQDLRERLALIETMIAEGRSQTQSWGWTFLLWGIAYYVAIAWTSWGSSISLTGRNGLAWPVTMIVAVLLTLVIGARKRGQQATTRVGHAVGSVWIALGISLLLLLPALAISQRIEPHAFVAVVAAFLGCANGTSGFILRWKAQIASAAVWWTASVVACFGSEAQLMTVFLVAIFLCQIVFGIYAMTLDARRRRPNGEVHA